MTSCHIRNFRAAGSIRDELAIIDSATEVAGYCATSDSNHSRSGGSAIEESFRLLAADGNGQ